MISPIRCLSITTVFMIVVCVLWVANPVTSATIYLRESGYCMKPPPRSEGLCTIDIEGFYYDPTTKDCQRYSVGGCRPIPGQSFGSRDDCLATCVSRTRHIQDLYKD